MQNNQEWAGCVWPFPVSQGTIAFPGDFPHCRRGSVEPNTLVADLLMEMYAFKFFQRCDNMCYFPIYIAGLYDSYDKGRFLMFIFNGLSVALVMVSGQMWPALGKMYKEYTL